MKPLSWFTDHPASVGETYLEHLASASRFSLRMMGAGACCLLHGLLPFLFVRTGSTAVTRLHERMVVDRERPLATVPESAVRNADVLNPR